MTSSAMEFEAELEKRGAPFKYGLVNRYLRKFRFEDEEHVPNSEYYSSDDDDDARLPNAHDVVKRFLKQVRESNGYDVDCFPPPRFSSPFTPRDPNTKDKLFRDDMMRATHFTIQKINAETGRTYELVVQVEKAIHTRTFLLLLTFTVKKAGANNDASLKTIRAMVDVPYRDDDDFTLEEWMFKPPATDKLRVDMDPEKKKVKIGLEALETSVLEHIFSALDKKSAICLSFTCKNCWFTWVSLKKSST